MAKNNRAIVVLEGVVFGSKRFKPGMEAELADSDVPAWNLREMEQKGFISGDWSNAGLTTEEEAEVVAESAEAAAKKTSKR